MSGGHVADKDRNPLIASSYLNLSQLLARWCRLFQFSKIRVPGIPPQSYLLSKLLALGTSMPADSCQDIRSCT